VEGIPSGFTLLVKIDWAKIGKFGKYGEGMGNKGEEIR
jgi:hypothetical protein